MITRDRTCQWRDASLEVLAARLVHEVDDRHRLPPETRKGALLARILGYPADPAGALRQAAARVRPGGVVWASSRATRSTRRR